MKERLKIFMKKNGVNAKQLSDKIGVQASSISHILTGRNKPSIDLVEKLLSAYPSLNLKWLIAGLGEIESEFDQHSNKIQSEIAPVIIPKAQKVVIFYDDGRFEELVSIDGGEVD